MLQDFGYLWELNTQFKPYRFENMHAYFLKKREPQPPLWIYSYLNEYFQGMVKHDKPIHDLHITAWPGIWYKVPFGENLIFDHPAGGVYLYTQFFFRSRWSIEWYIRSSSNPNALAHFTPYPRKIRRLGMNSAEFDQATINYHNDWLTIQLGRNRQIWGPWMTDNLMLSSQSASYDHLMAKFNYKKISGIFFTGFLEALNDGNAIENRYIAGHAIQFDNHKNLSVSLAEVTVYSGKNRPLDIAYLNPLIPHIAVELNRRENVPYGHHNSSNGVYFLSWDWFLPYRFRFCGTYLIDEIQFDKQDRKEGRPNAIAFRIRLSKAFLIKGSTGIVIYQDYDHVGTYTFRHEKPYTQFVSRNLPLGTPYGSDYYRYRMGIRTVLPFRLLANFSYSLLKQGQNNLLQNKYTPYQQFRDVPFPSGEVSTKRSIQLNITWSAKPNFEFQLIWNRIYETFEQSHKTSNNFLLQADFYFPIRLSF